MKICKKINFGRSLFLVVLTSEGYFGNYEKFVRFMEKAISGKIVADFQTFKTSKVGPKRTSFGPPNILNKLLSRNPTLTRRCEVNKFNLITLYKYQFRRLPYKTQDKAQKDFSKLWRL